MTENVNHLSLNAKETSYFIFWLLQVLAAVRRISISMWHARPSVATCTLSRGMQDLVPRPGIEPRPSALGAQSLSHWSTKEVQKHCILLSSIYYGVLSFRCVLKYNHVVFFLIRKK